MNGPSSKRDDSPDATVQATPVPHSRSAAKDRMLGQTMDGRFKLRLLLGEGGMGRVYLAEDSRLNSRRVAVKLMGTALTADPEFRARFQREALLQANLPHPQIMQVIDVGECAEGAYIVMEYSDGRSLSTLIKELGPCPLPRALDLVEQILEVLDFAHRQGVIHRDLKPSNILVEERSGREVVRILDFGIAKLIARDGNSEDNLTRTGHTYGTLGYMSPEQACGSQIDHRADLYSVGTILYELLTGAVPCPPESRTHPVRYALWVGSTDIAPITKTHAALGLPEDVDRLLGKALAKDASARFGSALAFLNGVRMLRRKLDEQERRDAGAADRRADRAADASAGSRRATSPVLLAVLALVLVAAAAGWFLWSQERTESAPLREQSEAVRAALASAAIPADDAAEGVRGLVKQLESLSAALPDAATKKKLADTELELGEARTKLETAAESEKAALGELKTLEASVRAANEERDALRKRIDELEKAPKVDPDSAGEVSRLTGRLKEVEGELTSLREAKSTADTELAQAIRDRDAAREEVKEYQTKLAAAVVSDIKTKPLQEEITKLQERLRAEKERADRSETALSEERKRAERAESSVSGERSRAEQAERAREELARTLAQAQAALDSERRARNPGPAPDPSRSNPPPPPPPVFTGATRITLKNAYSFQVRIQDVIAVMPNGERRVVPLATATDTLDYDQTLALDLPSGATSVEVRYAKWDRGRLKFSSSFETQSARVDRAALSVELR